MKKLRVSWVRVILIALVIASTVLTACSGSLERSSEVKPTSVSESGTEPTAVPESASSPEPVVELEPVSDATQSAGLEYVGLPADEVHQLREQCLAENPDSLCLPLPVDPTQPGVRVEFGNSSIGVRLSIAAPVGTEFLAPCDSRLEFSYASEEPKYWVGPIVCGKPQLLTLCLTLGYTNHLTSEEHDALHADRVAGYYGTHFDLGERLFTLKTAETIWVGDTTIGIALYRRADFHGGGDRVMDMSIDEVLLFDSAGRIIYILSSDSTP